MKSWKQNQLLITIISIVTLGSIALSSLLTIAIVTISNNSYVKSYTATNNILITELTATMDKLNETASNIFRVAENSNYVYQYFFEHSSNSEDYYNLNYIREEMKGSIFLNENIHCNLSVLGANGNYFYLGDSRAVYDASKDILLNSHNYISDSDKHIKYIPIRTDSVQGLGILKSIYEQKSGVYIGCALMLVSEKDLHQVYASMFDPKINKIYMIDSDGNVISTNNPDYFGRKEKELLSRSKQSFKKGDVVTYDSHLAILTKKTYYSDFYLSSVIDTNQLIKNLNLMPSILVIVIVMILSISVIMNHFIKQSVRPVYKLIHSLSKVSQGNFSEKLDIRGGYEIRQLTSAYNAMLSDLNHYFIKLKESEAQKRSAEIHALQMQIRPHFLYNTLAVIKQLTAGSQNEKAMKAIESLILLLRSTIGSSSEYKLIKDEISTLRSYLSLLELRYGAHIQVNFFVDQNAEVLYIPQMIIQPFIENVFFHAFPNGREGFLNIFIQRQAETVAIQLIDNGIGFVPENTEQVKDHLSGLGIRNVTERIQAMFGQDYGVTIQSIPQSGTTVTIRIPAITIKKTL